MLRRLPRIFNAFRLRYAADEDGAVARRADMRQRLVHETLDLARIFWPPPEGAGVPIPERRHRAAVGGHLWRVRCSAGRPTHWVAADAHPSAAEMLVLGQDQHAASISADAAFSRRRRIISPVYAICCWGSLWGDILSARGVEVDAGCGTGPPLSAFYSSLSRVTVPSRIPIRRGRQNGGIVWFGVPLSPNAEQLLYILKHT